MANEQASSSANSLSRATPDSTGRHGDGPRNRRMPTDDDSPPLGLAYLSILALAVGVVTELGAVVFDPIGVRVDGAGR